MDVCSYLILYSQPHAELIWERVRAPYSRCLSKN
jgi:hypothetical protein